MPAPFDFDFINPDYFKVWAWRHKVIKEIRANNDVLPAFRAHYAAQPWDFITHWGNTFDPRNADIGLDTYIPFILFERQEDAVKFIMERWRNRENGLMDKSRDGGLSWLAMAFSCTIGLFIDGVSIGFGSRKEELVDKIGDPKCLFWKGREFLKGIPADFKQGFDLKRDAPHMRISFPNGSTINGEGGDGIGRGDRKSIYFVDESAYLEHPEATDASLSNTTNCRIDISSARGMGNPFAQKRHSMHPSLIFTFHYRDDPRKVETNKIYRIAGREGLFNWYDWMKDKLNNPVVFAQEVEINYMASVEGVVIPGEWITAAIDACKVLGIEPSGNKFGALDVADGGKDLNAMALRKGVQLERCEDWSGKDSDTFYTAQKAFRMADEFDCVEWQFDGDGIGAGIKGDARVINEQRKEAGAKHHDVVMFRGSGKVLRPLKEIYEGRKNEDYFLNRKAQEWWTLRTKFQTTFRAVEAKKAGTDFEYDPEQIISISGKLPNLTKIVQELSQPTFGQTPTGKMIINKTPEGTRSPNLADAVMMAYSEYKSGSIFFLNLG